MENMINDLHYTYKTIALLIVVHFDADFKKNNSTMHELN